MDKDKLNKLIEDNGLGNELYPDIEFDNLFNGISIIEIADGCAGAEKGKLTIFDQDGGFRNRTVTPNNIRNTINILIELLDIVKEGEGSEVYK